MKVNSQLERAQLENLTSLPAAATAGRVAWDSVAGKAFLDDATNWRAFLRNDQKAIIGNSGTAADNIRFHRGANGVLQVVSGADATAEGTLSTALNQLSFRAENYSTGSLPTFGSVGRIAFDTTTGFPKFDTGAAWKEVVDSSSTQTISGKTLVSPTVNSAITGEQIATPTNPSSGFNKVYPKADGKWYNLKSDGVEEPLGSGSGAGGINYVTNPTADSNIIGWATYSDAAGALPVDGTGGSPSSTLTRSTTTPLRGAASFLWTKSAANRQGEGFSYDFTIDAADKAKVLQISFDYFVASGTYADGDLTVYIYDVTNAQVIQPTGYTIQNALVQMKQSATFQTASNSTSYRLIVHTASTSASAYSLQFDSFAVGPQIVTQGAAITDWQTFTPTGSFNTNTTYTGMWRRVGDSMEMQVNMAFSGAPNSVSSTVNLPSGMVIDTTKIPGFAASTSPILATANVVTATDYKAFALYGTTTSLALYFQNNASGSMTPVTQLVPGTLASTHQITITSFRIPILGWSSNLQLSSDTDTRVVAFSASNSSTSVPAGTTTDINFTTLNTDTHGGFASPSYVVKVSGIYDSSVFFTTSNPTWAANDRFVAYLNINGSQRNIGRNDSPVAASFYNSLTGTLSGLNLKAGDVVKIQVLSDKTITFNSAEFSLTRRSGPSTIAASESISFSANTSTTAGTTSQCFIYSVKDHDTHSAYSTSTGKFTAPIAGKYSFQWTNYTGATAAQGIIYKNGTAMVNGSQSIANVAVGTGSTTLSLLAGDVIELRPETTATASGVARLNSFSGFRVGI